MVLSEVMALRLLRLRIDAATTRLNYLITRYRELAERCRSLAINSEEELRKFYEREADVASRISRILSELKLSLERLADLADKDFRRMTEYEAEELLHQISNLKLHSNLPYDVSVVIADLETSLHEYLANKK